MPTFIKRSILLLLCVPIWGCEPTDPLPDASSGGNDSGPPAEDAGTTQDAGTIDILTPPQIRCVYPPQGGAIRVGAGEVLTLTVDVLGAQSMASIRIGGQSASVDEHGLASASVTTHFGAQSVMVEAEDAEGVLHRQLCSFLAADDYRMPGERVEGTAEVRLTPGALDDEDSTDSLGSIDDVLLRTLRSGLLVQAINLGLPINQIPISELICMVEPPLACADPNYAFLEGIVYSSGSPSQPGSSSLAPIAGGLRFTATGSGIQLNVHVTGQSRFETIEVPDPDGGTMLIPYPIDHDGVVQVGTLAVVAELSVGLDSAGRIIVALASLESVETTSVSIAFPSLEFHQDEVERRVGIDFGQGPGDEIRAEIAATWVDTMAKVLTDTFGGLSTASTAFDVPTLTGSTTTVGVSSEPSGVEATDESLTITLAGNIVGDDVGASVAIAPSRRGSLPIASQGVGTHLSDISLNQALHAAWSLGGLSGTLDPERLAQAMPIPLPEGTLDPMSALRPNSIDIEALLPPTLSTNDATGLRLSLGGIVARLEGGGPFDEAMEIHFSIEASTGLDSLTAGLRVNSIDVLAFSADRPLSDADRVIAGNTVALIAQHLANLALSQTRPALELPSFALPQSTLAGSNSFSTGIAAGTRMGHVSPSYFADLQGIGATGPFGQLP